MKAPRYVVTELIERFPELRPLLDEHLSDQEGELLPYLLMGDIAQWLHEHSASDAGRVAELLAWLDEQFANGDFDIRNLIDVGIVEMLPALPDGADVLDLLGPELRSRAGMAGLLTEPTDPD